MARPKPIETALPALPRVALVDALRGVAILAMVIYHFAWDLSYYRLIATDVTTHPAWVLLQRSILSSFLALVGVSLVLGHGNGVRWPSFWRRLGIIVGAALAVTLGTYWMFPEYFVFFGILHAIALFSVLALPFLRTHPWLVLVVATLFLVPPLFLGAPQFSAKPLAWIGFWTTLPETTDIVPIFPWFGVVLLGMAAARLLLASPLGAHLPRWRARGPLWRGLVLCGRWSLLIYLLHQPIFLGGIMLLSQLQAPVLQPEVLSRTESFVRSCKSSCAESGGAGPYCEAYCACALEQLEAGNLWDLVDRPGPTRDEAVTAITRLCAAMADPERDRQKL
ncbi:MAG: DUF1624 domain-containing protein [Devosia sp.]